MKTLGTIIDELIKLNINIKVQDNNLQISGAHNNLTPELIHSLKEHKGALIAYLQSAETETVQLAEIPVAAEHIAYPLSSSQRRIWVMSQLSAGNLAYNIPGVYVFEGELKKEVLVAAIEKLVARHEILRTIFKENEQYILPVGALPFKLEEVDLRKGATEGVQHFSKDSTEEAPHFSNGTTEGAQHSSHVPDHSGNTYNSTPDLSQYIRNDFAHAFDLSKGPLFRAALYQVEDKRWVFTYVMHHIISDDWSMQILIRELLALYNNQAAILPALRIQYKDYASWQQQQLKGDALQVHKNYWLQQLATPLPVSDLPTYHLRPAVKTYNGASITHALPVHLTDQLKKLCRQQDASVFMGLVAVVNVLLYRYSGQEDIIIGSPIAGRTHADLQNQIGFYLNTLALRLRFKGDDSFISLLQNTRQVTLGAYEHQVYPFDQLVDDLQLQRDISRNPLFDVLIDYHQHTHREADQSLDGLKVGSYDTVTTPVSKFDLTFMFLDGSEGLSLLLEYNTDLFEAATTERVFTHLEKLLEAIVGNPGTAINELDYIDEKESTLLVDEFNNIPAIYEDYISVIDLFKQQPGDSIAVNNLSYAELDALSDKLAVYLKNEYGLKQDDLVGIMMERSEKVIIAILAILKAGAAYVPIDPAYPAARKEYIVTDAQLKALITQTDFIFDIDYFNGPVFAIDAQLDTIPAAEIDLTNTLNTIITNNLNNTNNTTDKTDSLNTLHLSQIPADALAYVIYTSGSTGQPKGCAITAGNLSHYIQWADKYYFDNQPANFGLFTSISFDLSVTAIFCPLTTGGKINTYDQITEQAFLENDALKITPSHISLLPSQSKVQTFILGGEQVNAEHVRALKSINPNVKIFNEYGPTETTVGCIVKEITDSVENNLANPILIGKPISNTQIYILDNHLCHVPIGIPGEIFIAGAGVAKQYLNNPTLTNEKFISLDGKRLYKTGDIAKWLPTGEIQYIGRKDEQVKINGYRIELGEIENSLLNHPDISAAVVIVTKQQQLAAYYVRQINETNSVSGTTSVNEITLDLKSYLHQQLPAYMVPLFFIQLDKLPLTENGKINKQQLPDPIQNIEYVAPSNHTEQTFVNIWQDILGKEKIGLTDNFFQLGGDSIKVLRMLAAVRKELNLDISISDVYKFNTINELLNNSALSEHSHTTAAENEKQQEKELELKNIILAEFETFKTNMPPDVEDIYPMSDIEKGMIFESIIHQSTGMYHDQMVHHRIFPHFDHLLFEHALHLLSDKHEILRTSFNLNDYEKEVQLVHKNFRPSLHYKDLASLPRKDQEAHIKSFLAEEMQRPFNIQHPGLWRIAAFHLGNDEVVFVFQCHHAIIDGWSDALLMTELNNLYLQLKENPTYIPQKIKASYKDFIIHHEIDRKDENIRQFWQSTLADYNRLDLFTNRSALQLVHKAMDKTLLHKLENTAAALNTSVKAISLSAYLYLLKVLNYEPNILTGLVSNMRPNIEDSDKILGCFLNTIPFKFDINEQAENQQFIKQVHEQLNLLKQYDKLSMLEIANIHSKNTSNGNPFFDVLFDYVDFHAFSDIREEETAAIAEVVDVQGGVDLTNTFFDFMINRTGGNFVLTIRLTRELKSGYTADTLTTLFFKLLDQLISHPTQKLDQLNYISDEEQELLLHEFNNIPPLYEDYIHVIDLFKKQPSGNIAVNDLSYKELDTLSDKLAIYLKTEYALKQDDLVGIMMERSEKVIIAILAILKAGAAYVPIDPAYPAARKEYIATDAQLKALITQTDFIFDIDYFNGPVFAIDAQLDTIPAVNIDTHNTTNTTDTPTLSQIPANALAYVIYTSGSTGQPKGCAITAGNLSHYIQWADKYYFDHQSANFGLFTSISFDLSVTAIFCPLTTGGKINVYEQIDNKAFTENECLKLTPSHVNLIKDMEITNTNADVMVNTIILGGEQVNEEHIRILKSLNPNVKIFNEYGPTETTVGCIVKEITEKNESEINNKQDSKHLNNESEFKTKQHDNHLNILIGKPISHTSIYILDTTLRPSPIGIPGEIFIAGAGLAKHYLNNPTLTAQKFISLNGKRLYKTGDIAKWLPTGEIQYIGRKDEQVKINGYRIELGEIENSLITHPDITAAVVIVTKQQQLAAYYVTNEKETNPAIRNYLQQQLPSYMVPLHLIQLASLPLTINGKVDKTLLPDPATFNADKPYIAPSTPTAIQLQSIWALLLDKEKDTISTNTNFFDLGGHSLTAIRLVSQIQKQLHVKLDLKDIFNNHTLAAQAALIDKAAHTAFSPIPQTTLQDDYPLSAAQRRIWILSQNQQSSIAYNMPGVYVFDGDIDIHALTAAFNQLIDRHEILRTVFPINTAGEPRQVILPTINFDIAQQALFHQPDQLNESVQQDFLRPFDLAKGPLLHATLYHIDDHKWVLTYVMHHIISDGWSMEILIKEVLHLYNGGTFETPLPIQYKDYAHWQQDQILLSHRDYWIDTFKGTLPVLELPTDKSRPAVKTYNGSSLNIQLPNDDIAQFKAHCQQQNVTLFTGLLALVTTLLHRYTAQEDIIIGTPVAGREHPDLEPQIGLYLNTLALRMQFNKQSSFNDLLQIAREITLSAYEHQVYPFDRLIEELHLQRDISHSPLFDVLIDYHHHIANTPNPTGLKVSSFDGTTPSISKYDLTFMFVESNNGVNLLLEYNTDLYEASTITRFATHLSALLKETASNSPIATLPYIPSAESQLLHSFNNVPQLYTGFTPIISLFKKQAPEAVAIQFGHKTLTYLELDEQSDRLAATLTKGTLIGIMLDRSEHLIISILAILKAGAAYVPIDPDYPTARKQFIINDANISLLITQTDYIFDLDYYSGNVFAIDSQLDTLPYAPVTDDDISPATTAYVIYTSGSTGQPKGCVLTAQNLSHYIQWANKYYFDNQPANFGLFTSVSFDLSVTAIFCPLTTGGKINIYSQITNQAFIENDSLKLTPSHVTLLQELEITDSKLTTVILGGEQVNDKHINILKAVNPHIRIFNEYGPTEATVGCIVKELDHGTLIGKPISATEIFILDDLLQTTAIGIPGEIFIAGTGLAKEYLNNPALTAQKFITHHGKRLYKTGDIGKWHANGEIQYLGRKDEQVKIRGYRIEPGEIENLLQSHPAISAAVVVVTKQPELIAYYVSNEEIAVKSYLAQFLPSYMLPAYYVQLAALPLTTNGKIDKKQLPTPSEIDHSAAYTAPDNDTEAGLLHIWQDILGNTTMGTTHSFFDFGGDSIRILTMLAAVRNQLRLDIPIAEVYKHNTIRDLYTHVLSQQEQLHEHQKQAMQKKQLISASIEDLKTRILASDRLPNAEEIEDIYPMSDIEKGMIYESQVKGAGIYHDLKVFENTFPNFDTTRFAHALQLLSDKHAILRASFNFDAFEKEVQLVHKKIDIPFTYTDLSTLPQPLQAKEIRDFSNAEMARPFNINEPGLWRLAAFYLGNDQLIFVFQCHHAIIDGWSEMAFITELNNLYLELGNNPSFIPAPLKSTYKDFIIQHEADKQDDTIYKFWAQELADANRLDLFSHERVTQNYAITLEPSVYNDLRQLAATLNTTVKVISLSAYLYLLKLLNYEPDVLTGLVTNTRPNCEDSEQILGCFLNTIPFRQEIAEEKTAIALINAVHEKLILLKDKERLSILEISRQHQQKPGAGNPFFDILFNYIDFHVTKDLKTAVADSINASRSNGKSNSLNISSQVTGNTWFDFTVDTTGGIYKTGLAMTRKLKSDFTAEKIISLYYSILTFFTHSADQPLYKTELRPETDLLLHTFNATTKELPNNTLISLFEAQVRSTPDKTLLINDTLQLTYSEVNILANQIARYLRHHYDVQPNHLVGIQLPRSEWMIITILGVLKSGAAYVPVDPDYPAERIAYILEDSQCKVLIDETELAKFKRIQETLDPTNVPAVNAENDLAYVIYTSGSTGRPKGCMMEHQGVVHRIEWMWHQYGFTPADIFLQKTTYTFDVSVWEILMPPCFGASIVICPKQAISSPDRILALVTNHGVTNLNFVPSMLNAFIYALADRKDLPARLKSLRAVFASGEALHVETVKQWYSRLTIPLHNLYGPTEATVDVTYYPTAPQDERIPIGKPVWNTQMHILGQHQQLLPVGIIGELHIGGIGLSRGYLNKPTLTNEKFINWNEQRLYKTGDLARWLPDGNIEYLGRIDDQVKVRGYRIELGEIERAILSHPAVETAVVNVYQNELVAYYVSRFQVSDLRNYLGKTLPAYMVPAYFIQLPELPLTASGKVNRKALPAPATETILSATEYIAPRNMTEQKLADIWQEVLSKPSPGVKDNFFESGGHSLKIIQLISRIRRDFEVELSPDTIFNNPTIEGIANEIESINWANNELFEVDSSDNNENFSI